jgi:hypothetical protein
MKGMSRHINYKPHRNRSKPVQAVPRKRTEIPTVPIIDLHNCPGSQTFKTISKPFRSLLL